MFLSKNSLIFTLLVLVCTVNCVYPDPDVPVFIWGSSDSLLTPSSVSPLAHIEKEQFSSELDKILKKDASLILFVDEKLSPEDFQCTIDDKSCFKNLMSSQTKNEFLYYPSVQSPLEVLKSKPNVEVITLDDKATESRQELLAYHDELMQDKIADLQKSKKDFVVFYTAKNPSLNVQANRRVTRQAKVDAPAKPPVYNLDGLVLLSFTNLTVYTKKKSDGVPMNDTKVSLNNLSHDKLSSYEITISDSPYILKFNVTMSKGYWTVPSVSFQDDSSTHNMRSSVDISGLAGFSFHCSPDIDFIPLKAKADAKTVAITSLQLQPFLEEVKNPVFGDSLDCVGFMSAPILAGLFVTFMLAAIVALGICMMMDLKTMDRFEDPKGKTITVTATE